MQPLLDTLRVLIDEVHRFLSLLAILVKYMLQDAQTQALWLADPTKNNSASSICWAFSLDQPQSQVD